MELLRDSELDVIGRLTDASNATFLCRIGVGDLGDDILAVYKPTRGERPLDDFPRQTLSRREVAAYALSATTGWRIVPPTVWRDGPAGPGMVQLWMEPDPDADVVTMVLERDPRLRAMAVFDAVANNTDRKGSHILPMTDGHVHGVDHGICFAVEPKLRTVLWGWRGDPLNDEELAVVRRVCDALAGDSLSNELATLLSPEEIRATQRRAESLLSSGRFPEPDPTRPSLPWPPF